MGHNGTGWKSLRDSTTAKNVRSRTIIRSRSLAASLGESRGGCLRRDSDGSFTYADYENDQQIASCSLAAQGLLVNLMLQSKESQPGSHVEVDGRPASLVEVADLVRWAVSNVQPLLVELQAAGRYGVVSP